MMSRSTISLIQRGELEDILNDLTRPFALFTGLQKKKKRSISLDVPSQKKVVLAAHQATCKLAELLVTEGHIVPHLCGNLHLLSRRWDAIWWWVIYISGRDPRQLSEQIRHPRNENPSACACKLIHILYDLQDPDTDGSGGSFRRLINSDRDIFDAVARSWFNQDREVYLGSNSKAAHSWSTTFSPYPTLALSLFFIDQFDKNAGERLVRALPGADEEMIALSATNRLQACLRVNVDLSDAAEVVRIMEDIHAYAVLVAALTNSGHKKLSIALLDSRAVSIEGKAVRRLLEIYLSNPTERGQHVLFLTLSSTLPFVALALETKGSPLYARQAVRAHIFASFLDLFAKTEMGSAHLDVMLGNDSWVVFAQHLSSMLHVHSVLGAVIKEFKKFTPSQLHDIPRIPPLLHLWNVTIERAICKTWFDKSRVITKRQCKTCQNFCPVDSRKICGRCQNVRYCSVACQTADWHDEHKDMCLQYRKRAEDGKFNTLLKEFLTQVVSTDIGHCYPGLIPFAAKTYPSLAPSELVITLNYAGPLFNKTYTPYVSVVPKEDSEIPQSLPGNAYGPETLIVFVRAMLDDSVTTFVIATESPASKGSILRTPLHSAAAREAARLRTSPGEKIARTTKILKDDFSVLKTVEWDIVDEIWARALMGCEDRGTSIWDEIERVVEELLEIQDMMRLETLAVS